MDWLRRALAFLLCGCVAMSAGCAETLRKTAKDAAKDAAPAAVEGSVNAAHQPQTRDRIAEVLADPQIRQATSELSQAIADGVLNSFTEKERLTGAQAASDAFVEHMSRTLAASLRHDLGPAVSGIVADSLQRSLDAQVEARLEVMARAVARGSMEGLADGWQAQLEHSGPTIDGLVKNVARTAGREATLGFQDAVATTTSKQRAGNAPTGDVLALAGRTSDSLLLAFRFAGWLLVAAVVVIAVSGIVWAVRRMRRPPRGPGRAAAAHAG
jgi:hypothetical protein